MDPITAVLLTLGALPGAVPGLVGHLLSTAGFYGVYRATRSKAALWLVLAPLFAYGMAKLTWLPERPIELFRMGYPRLSALPGGIGRFVLVCALIASVQIARAKVGRVLAWLTTITLAIAVLADSLSAIPERATTPFQLLDALARGWGKIGFLLLAISWITIALAPKPEVSLRPSSSIAGAVGACLLAAVTSARVLQSSEGVDFLCIGTAVLAWIISAGGLAALGRVAGPAAYVGLALVVLQIFGFPVALSIWRPSEDASRIIEMSNTLGALGFGIAAVFARTLPLREARWVVGGLFLFAFSAGMLSWGRVLLGLARIVRTNALTEAGLETQTFVYALVAWAAYLALCASPPREA